MLAKRVQTFALVALAILGTCARANPEGPTVVHGSASFSQPNANTLNVTTSTNKAIINWKGFDIGAGQTTNFNQPSRNSAVLNRVLSNSPSQIYGNLNSNGKVFLINQHGLMIGAGAQINTAGFYGSTLDITNEDFLKGNLKFEGGGFGGIVNKGYIHAGPGGNVVLIAPDIENGGVIEVDDGKVLLAAGKSIRITSLNDSAIEFDVESGGDNKIINLGDIIAKQGAVSLFADSLTHSGSISANGLVQNADGTISLVANQEIMVAENATLNADGDSGGSISVRSHHGDVIFEGSASAQGRSHHGGRIEILGERVGLFGEASVDASGQTGGGEVLVGGDFQGKGETQTATQTQVGPHAVIRADAIETGDGGKVIAWADDFTLFQGEASAKGGEVSGDGGFIEISGKGNLGYYGSANASAIDGLAGTVLFDPIDVIFRFGGTPGPINNPLEFADNTGQVLTLDPSALTDITESGSTATIKANRDIIIDDDLITSGLGGDMIFWAGQSILINADIFTNNGNLKLYANVAPHPATPAPGPDPGERGTGAAEIKQVFGTTIDAGNGNVEFWMNFGVGGSAGNIDIADVKADHVLIKHNGFDDGGSILQSGGGTITASSVFIDHDGPSNGTVGSPDPALNIIADNIGAHIHAPTSAGLGIYINAQPNNFTDVVVGDTCYGNGDAGCDTFGPHIVRGLETIEGGGLIQLNVAGDLTVNEAIGVDDLGSTGNPGDIVIDVSGDFVNFAPVFNTVGDIAILAGNDIITFDDITAIAPSTNITLDADSDSAGGGIIDLGAVLDADSGTINAADDTVVIDLGFATVESDMFVQSLNLIEGTLAGSGNITVSGLTSWNPSAVDPGAQGFFLLDDGILFANGGFELGSNLDNDILTLDKPLAVSGFSSWNDAGASGNVITGIGQIINNGRIEAFNNASLDVSVILTNDLEISKEAGSGLLQFSGGLLMSPGSQLYISEGTSVDAGGVLVLGNAAELGGGGTLESSVNNFGGIIDIERGDGTAGTLTINGSLFMGLTSTLAIDLGGNTQGGDALGIGYDFLDVTGTVTLGGTLALFWDNQFTAAVDDTFDLIQAGSIGGSFDTIIDPAGVTDSSSTAVVAGPPDIFRYATDVVSPNITFWIPNTDGFFDVDANWTAGAPGPGDYAVINQDDGGIVITIRAAESIAGMEAQNNITINAVGSLTMSDDLLFAGDNLILNGLDGNDGLIMDGIATVAGRLDWSNGNIAGSGSIDIYQLGSLLINPGADSLNGDIFNLSVIGSNWLGGAATGTGTLTNRGLLTLGGAFTTGVTVSNPGGGTLIKDSAGTTAFTQAMANGGVVQVNTGLLELQTATAHTGTFNVQAGATLRFDGGASTSLGTLQGDGSIDIVGGSSLTNTGFLQPGGLGTVGVLNVTGAGDFLTSGFIQIDIASNGGGSPIPGVDYDQLQVENNIDLQGSMFLLSVNNYTVTDGDTFVPITYGSSTTNALAISPVDSETITPTYGVDPAELSILLNSSQLFIWAAAVSGDWNTGSNWNLGTAPTTGDDAIIGFSGLDITIDADAGINSFSLAATNALTLSGGTFTIAGDTSLDGALNISGGTLDITGSTLTVNGGMLFNGSHTVEGGGTGTLVSTGTTTMSGAGFMRFNGVSVDNQGAWTMDATATQFLRLNDSTIFNNNSSFTMLATAGLGTDTGSGTFNNNGTFTLNSGGNTSISGNIAFNNAGGTLDIQGGSNLQLNGGGTFSGVTTQPNNAVNFNAGTFNINSGASFATTNALLVSGGTTNIQAGLTLDTLDFQGGTINLDTLGGTSTLAISSAFNWSGNSTFTDLGTATLQTLGTTTMSSNGFMRFNGVSVDNQGDWTMDGTATQFLRLNSSTVFNNNASFSMLTTAGMGSDTGSGTFNNNATVTLNSGGNTSIQGNIIFNNVGGTLDIQVGSNLQLNGGGTFSGVTTQPNNAVNFNAGTFNINSGASFATTNALLVSGGTTNIQAALTLDTLDFQGGTINLDTLGGTSTLAISSAFNWSGNSTFTDLGTATLQTLGTTTMSSNGFMRFNGVSVDNQGDWTMDGTATQFLRLNSSTVFNNNASFSMLTTAGMGSDTGSGTFNNNATVTLNSGGNTSISGNIAFNNAGGTLDIQGGSNLQLNGGGTFSGVTTQPNNAVNFNAGTFNINSGASFATTNALLVSGGTTNIQAALTLDTLDFQGGTINLDTLGGTSTLAISSAFNWSGNSTFTDLGTATLQTLGTTTMSSNGFMRFNGVSVDNQGDWTMDGTATQFLRLNSSTVFNNNGSFTFQSSAGLGTDTGSGTFNNTGGTLIVDSGVTTTIASNITLNNGDGIVDLRNDSTLDLIGATLTIGSSGTLRGNGTINGSVTSSGSVQPGGSVATGVLNITGNFTQTGSGILAVDLEGATPGSGTGFHDQLAVSGIATLDGALTISEINGFVPTVSDQFVFLTFASNAGDFNLKQFPGGYSAPVTTPTQQSIVFSNTTTVYFTNANGNDLWTDLANWNTGLLPISINDVDLFSANSTLSGIVSIDSGTHTVASLLSDGLQVFNDGADFTVLGAADFGTGEYLHVLDASQVTTFNGLVTAEDISNDFGTMTFNAGADSRISNDTGATLNLSGTFNFVSAVNTSDTDELLNFGAVTLTSVTVDSGEFNNNSTVDWAVADFRLNGTRFTNNGDFNADASASLVLSGGSAVFDNQGNLNINTNTLMGGTGSGDFLNSGTLTMTASSILTISVDAGVDTGSWDLGTGGIELSGGNYDVEDGFNVNPVAINGTVTVSGGTLAFNTSTPVTFSSSIDVSLLTFGSLDSGTDIIVNGVFNSDEGNLVGAGTFTTNGDSNLSGVGSSALFLAMDWTNNANIFWNSGSLDFSDATLTNNGNFIANANDAMNEFGTTSGFVNIGGAEFIVDADTTFSLPGFIQNGTLTLNGTTLTIPALQNGGTLRTSLSGTIDGDLTSNGTLAPGGSGTVGSLSVTGDLVLDPSGLVELELQDTANHDQIIVTGQATLDGTLDLSDLAGYVPQNNDTFQLLLYGTNPLATDFASVNWAGPEQISTIPATTGSYDLIFNILGGITWVGAGGGGDGINWTDDLNWFGGVAPTSGDAASIIGNFDVTVAGAATANTLALSSGSSLTISSGTLTLANNSALDGLLTISGGELDISGATVTLNGGLDWDGASTISGGGSGILNLPGVNTISGAVTHTLNSVTVNNSGTATYSGGSLQYVNGGGNLIIINNSGVFDFAGDVSITDNSDGGLPAFNNLDGGLIVKSAGTGTSTIVFTSDNSNEGSVDVQTGTLDIGVPIWTLGAGDSLAGSGTYAGDVVNDAGVIRPGGQGATGALTIIGDFTQNGTGDIEIEIASNGGGSPTPGVDNDYLVVNGDVDVQGTLTLLDIAGYTVGNGDSFTAITVNGIPTGQFDSVVSIGGSIATETYGIPDFDITLNFSGLFTWTGQGNGVNWNDPANWDLGVPGIGNDVRIGAFDVTVAAAADALTLSLAGGGSLTVNANSTLTIASSATLDGELNLAGGDLDISGASVTVNGAFNWSGDGTIFGSAGSVLNLAGPNTLATAVTRTIDAVTVNLFGNTTYSAGSLQLDESLGVDAIVNNSGVFDFAGDVGIFDNTDGGSPGFNNLDAGTLLKSAGAGTSTISVPLISNQGDVILQSGTLDINLATWTLGAGDQFSGTGSYVGDVINNGGIIRPGGQGNVGTLTILGDFTNNLGTLEVEIDGPTTQDVLAVTNSLGYGNVAGSVLDISLLNFIPTVGESHNVITCTALCDVTTPFGTVNQPGGVIHSVIPAAGPGGNLNLTVTSVSFFWDGGGDGSTWFDQNNWSLDVLPGLGTDVVLDDGDDVVFDGGLTMIASLTLNSNSSLSLASGTLTNAGVLAVNSGALLAINGGELVNNGNVDIGGSFTHGSGIGTFNANSVFNGSYTHSGGSETFAGTVSFNGTMTHSGSSTATVFNSFVSMPGTVNLGGGVVTFIAGANLSNLNNTWSGGTILGAAPLVLGSSPGDTALAITGSSIKTLNSITLDMNQNDINMSGNGSLVLANGATIDNTGGTSFNHSGNGGVVGVGTFINTAGTINKGAGVGTIAVDLINDAASVINVSGGTLVVADQEPSDLATYNVGAAGVLAFAQNRNLDGALNLNGTLIAGPLSTVPSGTTTLHLPSSLVYNGSILLNNANLDLASLSGSTLTMNAGSLLGGRGTVQGNVNNVAGVLVAGGNNTIGNLRVDGAYNQGPAASVVISVLNNGVKITPNTLTIGGVSQLKGGTLLIGYLDQSLGATTSDFTPINFEGGVSGRFSRSIDAGGIVLAVEYGLNALRVLGAAPTIPDSVIEELIRFLGNRENLKRLIASNRSEAEAIIDELAEETGEEGSLVCN